MRRAHRLGLIACMLLCAGCAAPAARFDAAAAGLGLERRIVEGAGYRHAVYQRKTEPGAGSALHVYFDGDGTPWLHGRWVAADPTPREHLTLRLMAADPAPSLYLGRPCYHGLAGDPGCGPDAWTDGRYAARVVESMAAALERLLADAPPGPVILIGYSGGGALAMLVAPRLPRVAGVLTVAANLDVRAWASRHGYSALAGSLDPASQPPLPATVRQVHVAGAADRNVPPAIVRGALRNQPGARFEVVEGADHDCCWEKKWPSILRWIDGH